jgi:hypothetical protein
MKYDAMVVIYGMVENNTGESIFILQDHPPYA